jgi:arylformamidase
MNGAPLFLSHPFDPALPTWLDNPSPSFEPYSAIADGDVCNQTIVSTLTHNGTHVDAAFHFDPEGRTITDYPPEFWVFRAPVLIDLPRGDGELIGAAELEPHREAFADADLLLVRSGFEAHRGDRERYGRRAPGFAADSAPLLRALPNLRALAMDFPSASSPLRRRRGSPSTRRSSKTNPGQAAAVA